MAFRQKEHKLIQEKRYRQSHKEYFHNYGIRWRRKHPNYMKNYNRKLKEM